MFVALLFFLLMLITSFSFFDQEKDIKTFLIYAACVVWLFLLAGFRPYGVDEDSMNYLSLYYNAESELIEPSFFLISNTVSRVFNDPRGVFVIYAFISVFVKGFSIARLTSLWFLSLAVWISHFYIMQDLTQIRVAVSSGFFLFAIYFLAGKHRWLYLLIVFVSILFHYSSAILLALVFLSNKKLTGIMRKILGIVPLVAYVLYFLKVDFVMLFPIPYIQNKIEIYEALRDSGVAGDEINVFNVAMLLKLVAYYLLLWKYEVVVAYNKYLPILLKIFAVSYFCFVALAFLPVLSFRLSELLGVVDILLIPLLAYAVRPRSAGIALVSVYSLGIFLLNIYYNEYLKIT